MKIKILYEDKDILAIEKPSGVSVHSDGRSKKVTISDWLVKEYPKARNVGEDLGEIKKPGIVHRLDNETSGVMLLAKTKKAYESLKSQFMNREIKKTYVAIVSGFMKNDHGTINKPIGRSPKDFRKYLAGRGVRGELREAETFYKVLKRFEAAPSQIFSRVTRSSENGTLADKKFGKAQPVKFTYLEVKPKTGRTHQIRVHMKYLNHPIVCDSLYNPDGYCPKSVLRLALHAKSIEFKNLKGEIVKVESVVPKEFTSMIK